MSITGNIPTEFKSGDSIRVKASLKDIHEGDAQFLINGPVVYKLKCIEKED